MVFFRCRHNYLLQLHAERQKNKRMNPIKSDFLLDPNITFLNFGSFGACPKPVFEVYQDFQRKLEFEPVRFLLHDGIKGLESSRKALAHYVNCHHDDLVYVTNPSYGINTIAKSIVLEKGDEILSTNLEYGAMDRTWKYYCDRVGAHYIQQKIALPIKDKATFLEDFWAGSSSKTKAIFISQITSATGLILPVKEICEEAKKRNILTIIDGAHVPAHLPLDLLDLNPDVYVGACHKWMLAPKGSSFLYVKKEQQHWVDPLLISWGYQSDYPSHTSFIDYHQTNGTRDFSAFLTVPAAIAYLEKHHWEEEARKCRAIAISNATRFCKLVNSEPICPLTEDFLGQMFSIPIRSKDPLQLHQLLFEKYKIEIPVTVQNGQWYLRYSIQAFNSTQDLDVLEAALLSIKKQGLLL